MEPETIAFASPAAFEEWLSGNAERQEGIWLRFYKKASGLPTIGYDEAVEIALCWGWIDGQKKKYDEASYVLRFTPRRKRSVWSKVNTERVERLMNEGRMRPEGVFAVEAAKKDGRWEAAYHPQSTAEVPPDFQAALDAHPAASAFFATISKANRYAMIYRVQEAKKAETRERRINLFIEMLEAGDVLHP